MQVLNNYIDRLSRGHSVSQHIVQFCTASGGQIRTVEVVLPASGNLGPLFHAFGLMSEDEASSHHAAPGLLLRQLVSSLLSCLSTATNLQCSASFSLCPQPDFWH